MKTKLIALPSSSRVRGFFKKNTSKSAKLAGTVLHTTVMLHACAPGNSRPAQPDPTVSEIKPAVGYEGVEIEITGANLSQKNEATRVFFGDGVTTPISVNGAKLRVLVPQGATPGKVIVRVGSRQAETPPFVLAQPDAAGWKNVAAGSFHTCAVKTNGALLCWGSNSSHQLGYATQGELGLLPMRVGERTWDSSIGGMYLRNGNSCALHGGALFCWGDNDYGQYGDSTYENQDEPVATNGETWRDVSIGAYHSCGVTVDGLGYCWGRSNFGQLGLGDDVNEVLSPAAISGPAEWISVRAGSLHTCGISTQKGLYCWGKNSKGQLGNGDVTDTTLPVAVGLEHLWKMVAPGSYVSDGNTCALTQEGRLFCWGDNSLGQLGNGTFDDSAVPTDAQSKAVWEAVSVGGTHVCGIQSDRSLWCWGGNDKGQLGLGTASGTPNRIPQQVGAGNDWVSVTTGAQHACAINSSGRLFCWGDNSRGQLGVLGPDPIVAVPTLVEHSLTPP